MKLRYIEHSSYLLYLEGCTLLFDYYRGELPVLPQKPLFVLVSHGHDDHFSKRIFDLAKNHPEVYYILSEDVAYTAASFEEKARIVRVGAGEERRLCLAGVEIFVRTCRSTDEGVAFLLDVEGRRVYYAGDLNYWYWEGESEAWNQGQKADYERELSRIREWISADGKEIDLAFLPLDNRQGEYAYLGIEGFLREVGCKRLFPMHFNGSFQITERLRERIAEAGEREKIVYISKENEEFVL